MPPQMLYDSKDLAKGGLTFNLARPKRTRQLGETYDLVDPDEGKTEVDIQKYKYNVRVYHSQEYPIDRNQPQWPGSHIEGPASPTSYYPILSQIKKSLKIYSIANIHRERNDNVTELGYEIRILSKESKELFIDYIDQYPFFSSKICDYITWLVFHQAVSKRGIDPFAGPDGVNAFVFVDALAKFNKKGEPSD